MTEQIDPTVTASDSVEQPSGSDGNDSFDRLVDCGGIRIAYDKNGKISTRYTFMANLDLLEKMIDRSVQDFVSSRPMRRRVVISSCKRGSEAELRCPVSIPYAMAKFDQRLRTNVKYLSVRNRGGLIEVTCISGSDLVRYWLLCATSVRLDRLIAGVQPARALALCEAAMAVAKRSRRPKIRKSLRKAAADMSARYRAAVSDGAPSVARAEILPKRVLRRALRCGYLPEQGPYVRIYNDAGRTLAQFSTGSWFVELPNRREHLAETFDATTAAGWMVGWLLFRTTADSVFGTNLSGVKPYPVIHAELEFAIARATDQVQSMLGEGSCAL